MPRRPRVFIEGGLYQVHNRFARGAKVFREGDEADRFLDLLRETVRRDGLTVFAWALMSNQYHIALRGGPVPLSRSLGFEPVLGFGELIATPSGDRPTHPTWHRCILLTSTGDSSSPSARSE